LADNVLIAWKHREYLSEWLLNQKYVATMNQNNSSVAHAPGLDNGSAYGMAQPIYLLYFMGNMRGAEAWARSMSSLAQVVCTPAMHLIA
jgi:hypothetical protein